MLSIEFREEILTSCRIQAKDESRFHFWRKLCAMNSNEFDSTISIPSFNTYSNSITDIDYYATYCKHLKDFRCFDDEVLSSGQFGEIQRDVIRTFQHHSFFKRNELGSIMLSNVLLALLLELPDIGYCQVGSV